MAKIKKVTIIMCSMAAGMWVLGYLYWVMLSQFSIKVTRRIKRQYLEAILR
jgi:hypothetical protein